MQAKLFVELQRNITKQPNRFNPVQTGFIQFNPVQTGFIQNNPDQTGLIQSHPV
jgi:hypothetical protein